MEAEASMAPSVAESIVDAADSCDTDMIVISTHAVTGPARAILGSLAEGVVRTGSCPVLLVKRTHDPTSLSSGGEEELTTYAGSRNRLRIGVSNQPSAVRRAC